MVGRLTSNQGLQLVLETYFPYADRGQAGNYSVDESRRAIVGETYFDKVFNHVGPTGGDDGPAAGGQRRLSFAKQLEGHHARLVAAESGAPDSISSGSGRDRSLPTPCRRTSSPSIGWDKDSLLTQAESAAGARKDRCHPQEKAEAYAARRPTVQRIV